MAKLPFIEETTPSRPTSFGRVNSGSSAIGQGIRSVGQVADQLARQAQVKLENDRVMEEKAAIARFTTKESLFRQEVINNATTSDAINGVGDQVYDKLYDRFDKHIADDIGIKQGDRRYDRVRQLYDSTAAITLDRAMLGEVSKKNATFFMDRLGEVADENIKALILDPSSLQSKIEEDILLGLTPPPGVDDAQLKNFKLQYNSSLAFTSGIERIEEINDVGSLLRLKDEIFNDDSIYFTNLTSDDAQKLDQALNTRLGGLKAKSDKELNNYIRMRNAGYGEYDPSMAGRAAASGVTEELTIAEANHGVMKGLASGGPDMWAEAVSQAEANIDDSSPNAFSTSTQAYSAVVSKVSSLRKQLADNPWGYSLRYNDSLANKSSKVNQALMQAQQSKSNDDLARAFRLNEELISEVDAYQASLGLRPDQRRIVDNSHPIKGIIAASVASGKPDDVLNAVDMMEGMFGDYIGRAVSELGKDMPEGVLATMLATSEPQRRIAASNAGLKPNELTEAVRENFDFTGSTVQAEFTEAMRDYTNQIRLSHRNEPFGAQMALKYTNILERQAMSLMLTGAADSPKTAVTMAYDDLFDGNIRYSQVSNGDVVRIPRKGGVIDTDSVETALNEFAVNPGALRIYLDAQNLPSGLGLEGLSDRQIENRMNQLMRDRLRYINSRDGDRVELYLEEGLEMAPLTDSSGVPISLTIEDLQDWGMKFSQPRVRAGRRGIGAE